VIKVLSLFGTRPEIIKLAPVIRSLESRKDAFRTLNVASGQHESLASPFIRLFGLRVDHELRVMRPGQSPNEICARVLVALDPLLVREGPDVVLVQGDTTTTLAGALAAFHRRIPVGHVEAGLRTGDAMSPYPEEMNRRLVSRLATFHFAATAANRDNLVREGVPGEHVFVTGNTVVDALLEVLPVLRPSPLLQGWLDVTNGTRRIVLTTHRRESFGTRLVENLRTLRRFVDEKPDTTLVFPVHPNPVVVEAARTVLSAHPRIHLLDPLPYEDFLQLLSHAFLIVSDSGGVQEEAPTLGRPLLVLRENTERPEGLERGNSRLADTPARLDALLHEAWTQGSWAESARRVDNPFGRGDAAERIAEILFEILVAPREVARAGAGSPRRNLEPIVRP
jgi:UDP-N-acetylglucosamine 2-epimerase (non-hydrolysing)